MVFLMSCVAIKKEQRSQVLESEIRKTVSDGNVKVDVILRPKDAQIGEPISLDIYVHTTLGIDINTSVINSIGDFIIVERSFSGGGNSDGEFYSGRHFQLEASKSGCYKIPSFDVYYIDTTKERSISSEYITTKSFRYIVHK
jgi:hypothetical protein